MKAKFVVILLGVVFASVFARPETHAANSDSRESNEDHQGEHVVFDRKEDMVQGLVLAMVAKKLIPELLAGLNVSTLMDLVQKASIADALSVPGPVTVFVPSNLAFLEILKKMPNLTNDVAQLKSALMFHVVPGELKTSSSNWKNEMLLHSLQGGLLRVNVYNNTLGAPIWTVNGAQILQANLMAANGVIHVIDTVLCPDHGSILAVLAADPQQRFTRLLQAIQKAGLNDTLNSVGPYTLFAPVNEAFEAVPGGDLEALMTNPEKLKQILMGHVMSGTLYSAGMVNGTVAVLNGNMVNALVTEKTLLNSAEVLEKNISAVNGVIHAVSKII